jgi:hypothetical protein
VDANAPAFFYAPRPGVRDARSGNAELLYAVKAESPDAVTFEIVDSGGTVVRKLQGAARAGLNRLTWDLRYEGPAQVELRTIPPDNPYIWEEARFKGRDTRPILHWGIQNPQRLGPIATPGTYSVRMTAGGQTVTRPLDVLKNPKVTTTASDMAAATAAHLRIRDDINRSVVMINRLEVMRKQIEDLSKAHAGKQPVLLALRDLDTKMMSVELQLLSRTDLHSDDKWYVETYKVYMNLVWLAGVVGTGAGDVAGGAEYRPTDAAMGVLASLEKDLAVAESAYAVLIEKDVPAFNRAMAGKRIAIKTD